MVFINLFSGGIVSQGVEQEKRKKIKKKEKFICSLVV